MQATLALVLCLCAVGQAYNILYLRPFPGRSHNIMLRPLGLELALRGHNVTVVSAFRETNTPPNYHQVIADNKTIWEITDGARPNVFESVNQSAEEFHNQILWINGLAITEQALKSREVQHFLRSDNSYDLVISEQFITDSFHYLAHKYRAPLALITTYGNCMRHNALIRNPLQLATVLGEFLDVRSPHSFSGRFRNAYFAMYEYFWWRYWLVGEYARLADQYIPGLVEPVPTLEELHRTSALMLLNSHFSVDSAVAYLPNVVEIGGIHLKQSDVPLPDDLQKVMDEAKDGVIFMSFGSNIESSELPVEKRDAFLNVFRKLKQTVLWKWEDENLVNKPDNVIIRKWLPQKEIFAHPNIKVFIAHGGLIGMQEAIFYGVPIIGVPIYADQYNNLQQAQEQGFGKILEYKEINEPNLEALLTDVLDGGKYKQRAEEISRRFQDRPVGALDAAIFWVEYVIRNKGAPYMRTRAAEMSWIEYNMLDVYAVMLVAILITIIVPIKLVMCLLSFFRGRSKLNTIKKNN